MKKELLLMWHLGMGDAILCNGLIRTLQENYKITTFCKNFNFNTIKIMFGDLEDLTIVKVRDDREALKYIDDYRKFYDEYLGLGFFGKNFLKDGLTFEKSFYQQANIPFENRVSRFKIGGKTNLLTTQMKKYNFVHDDHSRGYSIDKKYLGEIPIYRPNHVLGQEVESTIFDYKEIILNADEIHCFNSSFACYIDSCEIFQKKKKYFHEYVKKEKDLNYYPLSLMNEWEVIEERA